MLEDLKLHTERQGYLLIDTDEFIGIEIVEPINPILIPELNYYDVAKHASHDQSSHGSWAGGGGYVAGRDLINEDYNNPILLSKEDTSFSLTSAGRTDNALNEIIKKQGFDGKAKLVDKEEFRQVLDSGGYARYRGITEYTDSDGNLVSGDNIIVAFAEGEYRSGLGVSGNGIYTTHSIDTAEAYASKKGNVDDYGNIVRMAILPNAKIATEEQTSLFINEMRNPANSPYLELGRIMAAKGFDGYVSSGNGVPSTIMLNRTAMVVLKP